VEDEYHFLFHCNKLENDINLLLKEIAKSCPNFKRLNSKDKLVWLMNTEEKSVLMLKVLLYADLLVFRAKKRAMLFHVL
jgi:hypothetical protein